MSEPALDQIARWRRETPATSHRIHLNNAGAGLMPAPVVAAMTEHLSLEAALGGYEAADAASEGVARCYQSVARLVNSQAKNLAMVENATTAVALALSAFDFSPGDSVVTTRADYVSHQIALLHMKERLGIAVHRADDLPEGGVDPASIDRLIQRTEAKLVVVSWVPTNSGLIQDVAAVGRVCRERGVPFLVDGCQAIGHLPVDVQAIGCDFFAATARKFLRGPRGQGFLFVSDWVLQSGWAPLYLDLRGATWTDPDRFVEAPDARRFENWEFSYANLLGLGAAAEYAWEAQQDQALQRTTWLAGQLRERLAATSIRMLDRGTNLSAIVTLDLGRDAAAVMRTLRARGVNTSSWVRTSATIDADAKGVTSALRLSPHYYNTLDELDQAVAELGAILSLPEAA